ncbi:MAG: hypothetical protein WC359_14520 [Dehalococcoidia bacterium]
MYLGYAEEREMHKARVMIGQWAAAHSKKGMPREKPLIVSSADETPDRAAFYRNPEIRKRIVKGPQ